MQQHFLPCLVALALAASCSSKKVEVPETPEPPQEHWYLYGWVLTNPEDANFKGNLFKIGYNADSSVKRLVTYNDKDETKQPGAMEEATYENGHLTRHDSYAPAETPIGSTTYERKDGRVVRGLNYAPVAGSTQLDLLYVDSFYYDNGGRLASHKKYYQRTGYPTKPAITEYTWTNENVTNVKMTDWVNGKYEVVNHYNFEYSDRKNFTLAYFRSDFLQLKSIGIAVQSRSRNLCTKRINVLGDPLQQDTMYYAYVFAENGLPVSKEVRSVNVNNGQRTTWTSLQTYDFRKLAAH